MKKGEILIISSILIAFLILNIVSVSAVNTTPTFFEKIITFFKNIFTGGSANMYAVTSTGAIVKTVVPHLGALKCDVIDKVSLNYNLPESGIWISKSDIGFKSKVINDIQYSIEYGFWESLGKDIRINYKLCDVNKQNCGAEQYAKYVYPGQKQQIFNSIDVSINSMFIKLEKYTLTSIFTGWKPASGGILSYSAEKYGLNLYSTTGGFRTVCTTSCDLSCPEQMVRSILIETSATTLNFYESTNYLEYWVDVSEKGEQLGGTIWIPSKNEFCFGGFIYTAGTITTEDGTTYIYPKTYHRKVECCPGASISITNGDKICQTDYTWKTILIDTPLPDCQSDYSCPGQGQATCNAKTDGYYKSGYFCNQYSKCEKKVDVKVECCPVAQGCALDQVCSADNKCVGGAGQPPTVPGETNITTPSCIGDEKIFYTNLQGTYESGILLNLGNYVSQLNEGDIQALNLLPYFGNKATACCGGLNPSYLEEKKLSGSFNILGLVSVKLDGTADKYKCTSKSTGFCLEFAHKMLNSITKTDDCQTNTILFIVVAGLLVILLFGFIGGGRR